MHTFSRHPSGPGLKGPNSATSCRNWPNLTWLSFAYMHKQAKKLTILVSLSQIQTQLSFRHYSAYMGTSWEVR